MKLNGMNFSELPPCVICPAINPKTNSKKHSAVIKKIKAKRLNKKDFLFSGVVYNIESNKVSVSRNKICDEKNVMVKMFISDISPMA